MNSRVHPAYKTRYHVTNWVDDDRSLVERGDITLWITHAVIDEWTGRDYPHRSRHRHDRQASSAHWQGLRFQ